jgi:outer membrane protein OmpA-like peptidoglycan-associated protein
LSPRSSLVLEWLANMTFPDDAIDGVDETVVPGRDDPVDFGPFDLISSVTLGFKYNFKSALTPVNIVEIDCPSTLEVNETGTFTATINMDASTPLDNRWAFGDGATGTGLTTSHSYDQPGTYTVTFTSSNRGSSDTETCTVEVVPAPEPAAIVSLTANPQSFELCEPVTVNFSANVSGDTPVTYSWNFGDGSTGTGATPSHTYTEPGTYTVTLTATNAAGSDTRTITVEALDCESICDDITDLNSVYFGQNSSTLTEEARAALQENIEILRECPDICVRIEGFAGPGERNPQQLSEDRARAVEQFYIDNGIAASRLMAVGMGRVAGTSKKEGAAQYRRVDSIPVPCDELGE